MDIDVGGSQLKNLTKINILLGKNGSGKSTMLRRLEGSKHQLPNYGTARYITPERGGDLKYEGGIETNIVGDPTWIDNVRRRNRYDNFRQSSFTEFRRLETLVLRKIERDENPILLVEGEDDERIWQQVARTSQGRIKVWPCAAGDIQSLEEYENQAERVASAIYEHAKAYSLRDRDGAPYEIDDKAIVKRMRLFCRSAENLLLSDDVLESLGTNWEAMKIAINDWLNKYSDHPQYSSMKKFKDDGFDRQDSDVKSLRNVFMMLAGSQKPWEVAVGQSIARLVVEAQPTGVHSLSAYLGQKLVDTFDLRKRRPKIRSGLLFRSGRAISEPG